MPKNDDTNVITKTLPKHEKQPKNKVRFGDDDTSQYLTAEEYESIGSPDSITLTVAAAA